MIAKQKMKKTKLLALLMPLLALSMSGCGEEEKAPEYMHDKNNHWLVDAEGNVQEGSKAKHDYEEVAEKAVAATCSADGKKVEKCKVCGEEKESKVNKLNHELVDDAASNVAASCSQEGKTVQKCKNCDYKKETPIAKTAHTLGAGVEKTEGGKTYLEYECSVCHQKTTNMIKFTEWESIVGTFESGKLSTEPFGIPTWNVNLPAGEYNVYFEAKYSSSGAGKNMTDRSVAVTYNGADVSFDATLTEADLGLSTSEYREFTFFKITATGGNDKLTLQNPHYRFVFNPDGYIVFRPVVA